MPEPRKKKPVLGVDEDGGITFRPGFGRALLLWLGGGTVTVSTIIAVLTGGADRLLPRSPEVVEVTSPQVVTAIQESVDAALPPLLEETTQKLESKIEEGFESVNGNLFQHIGNEMHEGTRAVVDTIKTDINFLDSKVNDTGAQVADVVGRQVNIQTTQAQLVRSRMEHEEEVNDSLDAMKEEQKTFTATMKDFKKSFDEFLKAETPTGGTQ